MLTRAERAEILQAVARALVERTSWREAASLLGVSKGALESFLVQGRTPQSATLDRMEEAAFQNRLMERGTYVPPLPEEYVRSLPTPDWQKEAGPWTGALRLGESAEAHPDLRGESPDLPDVSFLKPEARRRFEELLGGYFTRGWRSDTISRAATHLVAAIQGANTLKMGGSTVIELTEEEQLQVINEMAKIVEMAYAEKERARGR